MGKIRNFLSAFLYFIPLVFFSTFFQAFIVPKEIFLLACLLLTLALNRQKLYYSHNLLLIAILSVYFLMHGFLRHERLDHYYFMLPACAVLYLTLLNQLQEQTLLPLIRRIIMISGVIVSFDGIAGYIVQMPSDGFTGNSQFSGAVVLCTIPFVLYSGMSRFLKWPLLAAMSFYPFLTNSMMLQITLIVFIFMYLVRNLPFSLKRYGLPLLLLLIFTIVLCTVNIYRRGFFSKSMRFLIWRSSISMLADNPAGIGMSNFWKVYNLYRSEQEFRGRGENTLVENAHNEVLNLLVEGGLPVLPLLAVFFYFMGRSALELARKRNFQLLSLLGFALFYSMISFPFRISGTFVYFALILALVEIETGSVREYRTPAWSLKACAMLIVLAAIYFSCDFFRADYYLGLAEDEHRPEQKNAWLRKSISIRDDYEARHRLVVSLRKQGLFEEAALTGIKALVFNKFDPYFYSEIGYNYIMLKDWESAYRCYGQARKILPWSTEISENYEKLREILKKSGKTIAE